MRETTVTITRGALGCCVTRDAARARKKQLRQIYRERGSGYTRARMQEIAAFHRWSVTRRDCGCKAAGHGLCHAYEGMGIPYPQTLHARAQRAANVAQARMFLGLAAEQAVIVTG